MKTSFPLLEVVIINIARLNIIKYLLGKFKDMLAYCK